MKKSLLLLGVIFVVYTLVVFRQESRQDQSVDVSPVEPVTASSRSFLDSLRHVPRVRSNPSNSTTSFAESDTSECSSGIPKITENARTYFAGYVLEYPCTAVGKGYVRTEQREGEEDYQELTLYLGLKLWSGSGSIWNDRIKNVRGEGESLVVILRSDGRPRSSPVLDELKSYEFITSDEKAGLDIYRRNSGLGAAVGVLVNHLDPSGQNPTVGCPLGRTHGPEDIFSEFHENDSGLMPCSASWNLTEDISLSILRLDTHLAYDFAEIYQTIQPEMKKIIKSRPDSHQ